MKKALFIALLTLATLFVNGQRIGLYRVADKTVLFGSTMPQYTLIFERDSAAIYELTAKFTSLQSMNDVFTSGNYLVVCKGISTPAFWIRSNMMLSALYGGDSLTIDGKIVIEGADTIITFLNKAGTGYIPFVIRDITGPDAILQIINTDLNDTTADHLDTLQAHNTRILALVDTTADHLDTLQAHNTRILALVDTTADHLDTLQAHNTRILALVDTTADHLDTLQAHNTRILALVDTTADHLDTLQAHNTRILVLVDTTADHLDTLQAHNTRILALVDTTADHLDTLQAHNTRINLMKDSLFLSRSTKEVFLKQGYNLGLYSAVRGRPWIKLTNTNADDHGSFMYFDKMTASPANNDNLGYLYARGKDSGGTDTVDYARISFMSALVANAGEAGSMVFEVMSNDGSPQLDRFIDITGYDATIGNPAVVINPDRNNIDLAVNSVNTEYAIYVDGLTGEVSVGDTTSQWGSRVQTNWAHFIYRDSKYLASGDSIIFFPAVFGWGSISTTAGTTWADFNFTWDGAVTLKNATADVASTYTALKLCIYDGGTGIIIKNNLLTSSTALIEIHYTSPDP